MHTHNNNFTIFLQYFWLYERFKKCLELKYTQNIPSFALAHLSFLLRNLVPKLFAITLKEEVIAILILNSYEVSMCQ